MSKKAKPHQRGSYYPKIRNNQGKAIWYICWYDSGAKQTRHKSTRVAAVGSGYDNELLPPDEVLDIRDDLYRNDLRSHEQAAEEAILAHLVEDYYVEHGRHKAGKESIYYAIRHFIGFLNHEAKDTKNGKLGRDAVLSDIKKPFVRRFQKWRSGQHEYIYIDPRTNEEKLFQSEGAGWNRIDTDTALVRAAINWNYHENRIDVHPYVAPVSPELKNKARETSFTPEQFGAFLNEAVKMFDQHPQVLIYSLILFCSGGRPEAMFDLHSNWAYDREHNLLHTNHPDRHQTNKYRQTVPVIPTLRPWLEALDGFFVSRQRRNIKKNEVTLKYGKLPITDIFKSFNTAAINAGLYREAINSRGEAVLRSTVSPISIRKMLATELAKRGVPDLEIDSFQGHLNQTTSGKHYIIYKPDYFINCVNALEAFWQDMLKHTDAHLRYYLVTNAENSNIIGLPKTAEK